MSAHISFLKRDDEKMISQTEGRKRFARLQKFAYDIMVKKNSDYSTAKDFLANFRECERFGGDMFLGMMTRISDKWSRICTLVRSGKNGVENESLRDTLIDLANYALLILVALEEEK